MLQATGIPTDTTVREVIDLFRRLYPRSRPLDELLVMADLVDVADRRPGRLSGGQRQRVALALALAGDPDVLFLDEPTVALDVEGRRAFWAGIRAIAARGCTVVFATHHLDEADEVADRIIVMNHGQIVADGDGRSIKAGVAGHRVRLTAPGVDPGYLLGFPSVVDVHLTGDAVELASTDPGATVTALVHAGIPLNDLEVTGADLEDAFLALTSEVPA
jgi:ABC-2 type transport system ATP-binding protein